jgi:N-glycosylase/DNA lyase
MSPIVTLMASTVTSMTSAILNTGAIVVPVGFQVLPLPNVQLSLSAVLKCGQSFRWSIFPLDTSDASVVPLCSSLPTHEYRLCLKDRVLCLQQSNDALFYRACFPEQPTSASSSLDVQRNAETLEWLKDYFQLDVDLARLYDRWSKVDPVFNNLRSRYAGIRMLRQDPWENLVS